MRSDRCARPPRAACSVAVTLLVCGLGGACVPTGDVGSVDGGKRQGADVGGIVTEAEPGLELGPLLGGRRLVATPSAGRYASLLDARQRRFLSWEQTLSESIHGGAMLDLREDGSARGCVWSTIHRASATGRYASRDGEFHRSDDDEVRRLGMRGRWSRPPQNSAASVELTVVDPTGCEPGPAAHEPPAPIVLHCYRVESGGGLPLAALVCLVEASDLAVDTVSMLLADTPRSGSWALREDLSHRSTLSIPDGVRPWLVLGSAPGLRIQHRDDREGDPPRVTLEPFAVEAPAEDRAARL
jgi:hypothetical protein